VAISNAMVHLHRERHGRGPTGAKTVIAGNLVTVLLRDVLTPAERTLADAGRGREAADVRRAVQDALRPELSATLAELTGRPVVASMSGVDVERNHACEVFVLEGAEPARRDRR
jgi:uncharacterized protein YbcI